MADEIDKDIKLEEFNRRQKLSIISVNYIADEKPEDKERNKIEIKKLDFSKVRLKSSRAYKEIVTLLIDISIDQSSNISVDIENQRKIRKM